MNQRERINKLMREKNITSDKELLIRVLNSMGETIDLDIIENKKGNFSKMLSGERGFPKEYILAIEKVLETSYAFIKEGVAFDKKFTNRGFRYCCYLNNYEAFKQLDQEMDDECSSIITNTDEYNKKLIDYIIEFKAIEGIRYLVNEHQLRYQSIGRSMLINDNDIIFTRNNEFVYLIAEILCNNKEYDLFFKIFNFYELIFYYSDYDKTLFNAEFFNLILNNLDILIRCLSVEEVSLAYANHNNKFHKENDKKVLFMNPFVNVLYSYATKNYEKYKEQINFMLQKTLELNVNVLKCVSNMFPLIKDVDIKKRGFIIENDIIYSLVFNPDISIEMFTTFDLETQNLINKNKDILVEYLNKNKEKISEYDEERLIKLIYEYSGIKDSYRNNERTLQYIKDILVKNHVSENFKKTLSDKIYNYLHNLFNALDKHDENYISKYQEIKWGMIFIELFEKEINNL